MKDQSIKVLTQISQSPAQTWDNFFNRINCWWSKENLTNSRTKKLVIQTFIGGHMYEDFGEGEGIIWGEVIGVDVPTSLQMKAYLSPQFGGPALSFDHFLLTKNDKGTLFEYKAEFIGSVSDSTLKSLESGWEDIFHNQFKPFSEK